MRLRDIPLFRTPLFRGLIVAVAGVVLALSLGANVSVAFNGKDGKKDRRGVVEDADVKNFGKVNDHIYRGGQPDEADYKKLAAIGIKTVIDLREHPEGYARRLTEDAGMQYINIGLNDKRAPTDAESSRFLQLVNDENNWPVFVHCAGGRHRTGVLLAVYRMEVDGWNARQAFEEMKDYKFYSRFGHHDLKEYVFEYYNKMMARRAALLTTESKAKQASGDGQHN
ncbi:MAG: tyrosine-protein phosphatase [Blastocatellia bacterium]|nr:tyrosine-protein phosphatase [Blastocatellia bacterium]